MNEKVLCKRVLKYFYGICPFVAAQLYILSAALVDTPRSYKMKEIVSNVA